jgi:hypothetical protein
LTKAVAQHGVPCALNPDDEVSPLSLKSTVNASQANFFTARDEFVGWDKVERTPGAEIHSTAVQADIKAGPVERGWRCCKCWRAKE